MKCARCTAEFEGIGGLCGHCRTVIQDHDARGRLARERRRHEELNARLQREAGLAAAVAATPDYEGDPFASPYGGDIDQPGRDRGKVL